MELDVYLGNATAQVSLVLDLRIVHDRWGSRSNPSLDGHLHYPAYIDRTPNESVADKILQYLADYVNRPSHSISFMTASTSESFHGEFVSLPFLQAHRETDRFLADSGVQLAQTNFHFRHMVFSSHLKSRVGNILVKDAALRINLNIDGISVTSRSHTHPYHTQNSPLLTSSLSLGVPVPRATQCM